MKVKWPKVLDLNNTNNAPICRWIDLCNGTIFRLAAFFTHRLNDMPRDGLFVGIERVGGFLFSLEEEKSWQYVAEKLCLSEPDAKVIADWINAQLGHEMDQQGEYSEDYYHEIEPYGLTGERFIMPLMPDRIEVS